MKKNKNKKQMVDRKNVLITGGCGFIASHIVNKFVDKYPNYNIINLDKVDVCSSVNNCASSFGKPNYKFIKGDICSADLVRYILKTEQIDIVIHAAAHSHVDSSFGNSFEFTRNNIYGTHVLLEACKDYGNIQKFIHVSTDEVYGNCVGERKTEDSSTNPTNPYSASKAAAESLVQGYINSYKLPAIITRGNNVYGPHQYIEKLIGKMTTRLLRNKKCCIHGDGSNRRHFLHVQDVVSAFDIILHKGQIGQVYNMGSVDEFTNIELVKKIIAVVKPQDDPETWIDFVQDRPFNDVRYYLSYDRLQELGWKQNVSFDQGLVETVEWYKNITPETYWTHAAIASLEPHPQTKSMSTFDLTKLT
jgi:UDP-glucose 4,6-dehydratase